MMGVEQITEDVVRGWVETYTLPTVKIGRRRVIKARLSDAEIEAVVKVFPQYALWLVTGTTAPECGQTSPEYDEANRNLTNPNAG